jgi:cardiolipin synthase
LKRANVTVARFLPSVAPWRVMTLNLRNHRKLLAVDGQIAFTGGMNIRHGNVLGKRWGEAADEPNSRNHNTAATARGDARPTKNAVQDLQFRVEGPVVAQLQAAFVNDWAFTTGEVLHGEAWFPEPKPTGRGVIARVITDGPDADFEKLRLTLLAALAEAQTSVQILTPYFLPDIALITALNLAALRSVRVDIILPAKNNLPFVHWASRAMWWQVLKRDCHIWLTPPPFDHSKLMLVDGHWVLLGSANWDARSLRLNFELNVECYGREFAHEMAAIVGKKLRGAREVTLAEVDGRALPAKLRDAAARLFSPFL